MWETHAHSDYGKPAAGEIGRQLRQSVKLILGPAVYDLHVLAVDIAGLFQALTKRAQPTHHRLWRPAVQESNHRHLRLPSTCRKRPRRSAAEQRDERAASHMWHGASSARVGGTKTAIADDGRV
jgi:hypothetical protein